MSNFVIITPARDEATYIEGTIKAMIHQTVRPLLWIIVNDGSMDNTGELIRKWATQFPFIHLINMSRDEGRNFARKAQAFNRGVAETQGLEFDFIGNLDADVWLEPHYYEHIIKTFQSDPTLGISGGIIYSKFTDTFTTRDHTIDSVGGCVQLFRRQCFEEVGGYLPLRNGGIDTAAEIVARMKGWKVRKSLDERVFEQRPTGFIHSNPLKARMNDGRKFHSLGYAPLFVFFRCIYRLKYYPYFFGSVAESIGYLWSLLRREPVMLPQDVVNYLRSEQRTKVKQLFLLGRNR